MDNQACIFASSYGTRICNNLRHIFPHTISHRVMTLKELTNGLPQIFLSLVNKEILCFPLNFRFAYRMHEGNLEDRVLFALRSQNVR